MILIFITTLLIIFNHPVFPGSYNPLNQSLDICFKVRINGDIFTVAKLSYQSINGIIVIDDYNELVEEKDILEKAFHVGDICGYFYGKEKNELRFSNFIPEIERHRQKFQEALNLIPWMEGLGAYAFDIGPRAVVEALKIAVSGGGSLASSAGKMGLTVSKNAAKNALLKLGKNPRPYLVSMVTSILNSSISQFDSLKKKAEILKDSEVLEYKEIINMEELSWKARTDSNVAMKMYQEISGDLITNLLRALQNSVDQIIGEIDYSKKIITSIFLAEQFKNSTHLKGIHVASEERKKWEKFQKDTMEMMHIAREKEVNKAVEISKKIPQFSEIFFQSGTALSLIIDSTGSMGDNDPSNSRIFAGELVLDQAEDDWELGIVDFDTSSRLIDSGQANSQRLRNSLNMIDSSGNTNIQSGLDQGFHYLEQPKKEKKGAILLTDGQHNTPSENFDFSNFIDIFAQKKWPVYTIGLTGEANAVLLSEIASKTGGMYLKAERDSDMVGIIDIIFSRFRSETLIANEMGEIEQDREREYPFYVDSTVSSINYTGTYQGSKVDFTLIDPSSNEITHTDLSKGIKVTEGKVYKILKVDNPGPGEWKAKVHGIEVSDPKEPFRIKISADTPIKIIPKGVKPVYRPYEPVEFETVVTGEVNLHSVNMNLEVTTPEGDVDKEILGKDFEIKYKKTGTPGVYYFNLAAQGVKKDGEKFRREEIKHVVVSSEGTPFGVGQITRASGGYIWINLGREIGLEEGKKIFVYVIDKGIKRKIAEGYATEVHHGESIVELTASWGMEIPESGMRVEIDRSEL